MTRPQDLRIKLISERERIPLGARQWHELVSANETNTVFQTFEWFDAWWRTFGDTRRLFFLLVLSEDHVVGFAALMLSRLRSGGGCLEFVGTGNADYQDFVLPTRKREAIAAIAAFLRAESDSWQRARFRNIPAASSTLRLLEEEGRSHGLRLIAEAHVPCPVLRLNDPGAAVERLLSKYSMRRPLNWFSRRGEVRLRHVTDMEEIHALLPPFFEQHVRRWRLVGRHSLFHDDRQRRFFGNLAKSAHDAGWLQFSVLEVAGETIAFHFGFDYNGTVTWYKPSFEVRYADHSPGLLLIRKMLEDAMRRQRRELDFTVGGEPFKERFANAQRMNVYVSVYHTRFAYFFGLTERNVRRTAGSLLRSVRGQATVRARRVLEARG